jgi:hypothetical protein
MGVDDAREALVQCVEARSWVGRGIRRFDRVEGGAGVGNEAGDPLSGAGAGHHQLRVGPDLRWHWVPGTEDRAGGSDGQQERPQGESQEQWQAQPRKEHGNAPLYRTRLPCRNLPCTRSERR